MLWVPTDSADVVRVATPPIRVTGALSVPSTVKVTCPGGVPWATSTVAVKVTGAPKGAGAVSETRSMVVTAFSIVWVSGAEALVK